MLQYTLKYITVTEDGKSFDTLIDEGVKYYPVHEFKGIGTLMNKEQVLQIKNEIVNLGMDSKGNIYPILVKNEQIVRAMLSSRIKNVFAYLPQKYYNNKEVWLYYVGCDPWCLRDAPAHIREDKEIIIKLLLGEKGLDYIKYIPRKFKQDPDIIGLINCLEYCRKK